MSGGAEGGGAEGAAPPPPPIGIGAPRGQGAADPSPDGAPSPDAASTSDCGPTGGGGPASDAEPNTAFGPTARAAPPTAHGPAPETAPTADAGPGGGGPALALYLAASWVAGPWARWILARRAARGREDPARLHERLGVAGRTRPPGRLIWVHAASVGEALSVLPLIEALVVRTAPAAALGADRSGTPQTAAPTPAPTVLLTTGTVASARLVAGRLPPGALHQYAPVDTARAVGRFLAHWRPDLGIWVESELWPRLITATHRRGVPMLLVNARISAASARRWGYAPRMARALVRRFARIVAQDGETAARLGVLGADPARLRVGGNLKVLAAVPGAGVELGALRAALAGRRCWLAASTHAPEEAAVADAHLAARDRVPGLLTLLAPRHPDRGGAIAADLAARGLTVARRSRAENPGPEVAVWLLDTFGEMGLWLRLAPVAFVGGSLAPRGGHNPFEPAALGAAILHGPDTANFAPAYAALGTAGGALAVADAAALARALTALLAPEGEAARAAMVAAAARVRAEQTPDLPALVAEVRALMDPP